MRLIKSYVMKFLFTLSVFRKCYWLSKTPGAELSSTDAQFAGVYLQEVDVVNSQNGRDLMSNHDDEKNC